VVESFDRLEVRPTALTSEHMISARRSINLELLSWGNAVPLLWKMQLLSIPLLQGVATYSLPVDTDTVLDTYVRTFQLPNQFNVGGAFTTTSGSNVVTVVISGSALQPGYWINITTPVAIGGLLLSGFYQTVTQINATTFTFVAAGNATSSVTGGTLPQFFTTSGSTSVTCVLANHGLSAGQTFNIAATTLVGNVTLLGSYTVASVTNSSTFIFTAASQASSTASAFENSNLVQFFTQSSTVDPIDRFLEPVGRTDYAMYPDKFVQGVPNVYWVNRTITPTITLYQVPDGNGPYVLYLWRMVRIQDAALGNGQTPDVHFLFWDALCAKLAARLAVKYDKAMLPVLQPLAKEAWEMAINENRERAQNFIMPELSVYYGD
jgi:hypothetical protein